MAENALGNDPLAIELGQRIEKDRIRKGWTQAELAKGLNLSQGAVCKWEAGTNFPTLSNLRRLALLFAWEEPTFLRYALRREDGAVA